MLNDRRKHFLAREAACEEAVYELAAAFKRFQEDVTAAFAAGSQSSKSA